jgi:hypothetical protein
MPDRPIACTKSSTRRVETPPIQASWMTRLIAIAALLQQFDKRHSLVGQCRNVKVAGTISFRTISRPEI